MICFGIFQEIGVITASRVLFETAFEFWNTAQLGLDLFLFFHSLIQVKEPTVALLYDGCM